MCTVGASCTIPHNVVRNVLVIVIKEIGYEVKYEHEGGINDDRKPGDIIAYNSKRNKNILIDVAMESRSLMAARWAKEWARKKMRLAGDGLMSRMALECPPPTGPPVPERTH